MYQILCIKNSALDCFKMERYAASSSTKLTLL